MIVNRLIQPKQINKYIVARVRLSGVPLYAGVSQMDVTSGLAILAATAGYNGASVPFQRGIVDSISGRMGYIANDPSQRCPCYDGVTGEVLTDLYGYRVYGRLTESFGSYTLSLFSVNDFGVETPFVPGTAGLSAVDLLYLFDFDLLPHDLWDVGG
jgi:hypothetical protein